MSRHEYTAVWCENGDVPLAGRLEVGPTQLRFEGRSADRQALRHVDLADLRGLHVARAPRERILGRPALVLDAGRPEPIRIWTPEPGAMHELIDALAFCGKSEDRLGCSADGSRLPAHEDSTRQEEAEMKRIVIGTDGSTDAMAAVREGVELAHEVGAAVTFVCVRTPSPSIFAEPFWQQASDEELTHARRAVEEAMNVALDADVDADYEILDGSAVEAVLDVARNVDAWLIVVGSRGRGAVHGALFGSVSKALVTHADRPVLVARERAAVAVV